ncbi:MMPL family transporter [Streptomyces liangshanensis]|uniref:MMPL family transporter n=1 Tax=Streptomyces liangshanensis TaxID=2717324 RepID=A0A6G9H7T5_9ACTN|nr:MMPL family transporter [Streptomyces liangshanensis]QIQ06550.1 MMPL family transporter [Streptomyces liangshanensis]
MATLLYRLGRSCFRRRRAVFAAWLALMAAVIAVSALFGGVGKLNEEFSIPGSESQKALDVMGRAFPSSAGTSAQLVFTAPEGRSVEEAPLKEAIDNTLAKAARAPQVAGVTGPEATGTVSPDGRVAVAQVGYRVAKNDLDADSLDKLDATAAPARAAGLRVDLGGSAFGGGGAEPGAQDLIGVLVAVLVLAVTFGSLLAAGLPLLTALAGILVGVGGVLALTGLVGISSTALTLALMIGLAVGIDYALFILSRHRSHLAEGKSPEESAALAAGTAGSAVVFAGLTVIIAMAGLSVVGIPFLTVMGLCAALAVLAAVAVALTLLPALLGVVGTRLVPKPGSRAAGRETAVAGPDDRAANLGERWVRLATAKPWLTTLAVLAALGALAWPAKDLNLALPDNGSAPAHTSQRAAYDTVSRTFGPGFNGPLVVLADTRDTTSPKDAAATIAKDLKGLDDVAAVAPPKLNASGTYALVQIVPRGAPDAQSTKDLVTTIRDRAERISEETGAGIRVTGQTAVSIDVSVQLSSALVPFGAVVVGLSLVLLLIVFRSFVVPLKAAAGFLLSVTATLGATVSVFQNGHFRGLVGVDAPTPTASFLPVVVMAVLFGLAMDYEVFLVSRIHESYAHTRRPLHAIHMGARHSARVVTAAALIMVSVFAAFISSEGMILKQVAFALALGVLVDAFVVRMTLVPAVLALTRHAAWWLLAGLARRLPDVDLEGARLNAPRQASGQPDLVTADGKG